MTVDSVGLKFFMFSQHLYLYHDEAPCFYMVAPLFNNASIHNVNVLAVSAGNAVRYDSCVAADPSFPAKSIAVVFIVSKYSLWML
jgi:hypothetical protein